MRKTLILGFMVLSCLYGYAQPFTLVSDRQQATIQLPISESECVRLAVLDLVNDVRKITGKTLSISPRSKKGSSTVYIQTIPNPAKWESYAIESRDGNLYITGSDERGTMFGIYQFIEAYLNVDPLYFWAGREPQKRADLSWEKVAAQSNGPSFKFRGWFINDEDLLTFWQEGGVKRQLDYKFYGQLFHQDVIRHAVEALVRSRYNLFIPASFLDILNPAEEELVRECARRGVFISQHHQEPMGVSPFAFFRYWKEKGKEVQYSYVSHPNEIREVWREATKKWAAYPNVIWQLGLRGIGDRAVWITDKNVPQSDEQRGQLISGAIADQVKILEEIAPGRSPYSSITLWAEGSMLNQKGLLTIPAGTIIVFADNSPGWKWQKDFYDTPRNPKNRYGIYYHHALIGSGPHLVQVVPPHKTFAMLQTALANGAGDYVVCNVSNIREFVLGIDATAKMTWNMPSFNTESWFASWINNRFSSHQPEIRTAYQIYFNAYQIHDKQQVPFLMDGQLFGAGNTTLTEMSQKFQEKRLGAGTDPEPVLYVLDQKRGMQRDSLKTGDAFWEGLRDALPEKYSRRETIKRVALQKTGLELAVVHAEQAATSLPAEEVKFLNSNLIYPSNFMFQTCAWLEQLQLAHEALDLGDLNACVRYLEGAENAFVRIPVLANGYNDGHWANWYRGAIILNVEGTLQKTRNLLAVAKQIAGNK